jgi:hypothetical protein
MGRTVPTFREQIEQATEHWVKFRRALRREDQQHFARLFRIVRSYTYAATYPCHDNPMETILLTVCLSHERRIAAVEQILCRDGRLPPEVEAPAVTGEFPFGEG